MIMGCFNVTELNSGVRFSFGLIFKMAARRHIGLPRYLGGNGSHYECFFYEG